MVLIIYAHPNKEGNCGKILRFTEEKLKENNISYELLDLYAMDYDPRLHADEHYTSGKYNISQQNKEIQQKILDNKDLIFIYPVWWGSMPAILKGFFDRVLTSRYAYKYVNGIPIGLLKNKAIIMATAGGPSFFYRCINRRPMNTIKKDILFFCGIKSSFNLLAGSTKVHDDDKVKKFVGRSLKNIKK